MSFVTASIVVVWAVLLGAAYLCRVAGGLSRQSSAAAVIGSYLILSALALSWFGLNGAGILGVFGMLLPCAVAIGIAMIPSKVLRSKVGGPTG